MVEYNAKNGVNTAVYRFLTFSRKWNIKLSECVSLCIININGSNNGVVLFNLYGKNNV